MTLYKTPQTIHDYLTNFARKIMRDNPKFFSKTDSNMLDAFLETSGDRGGLMTMTKPDESGVVKTSPNERVTLIVPDWHESMEYYIYHEMSHHARNQQLDFEWDEPMHGDGWQLVFKELCPVDLQKYEERYRLDTAYLMTASEYKNYLKNKKDML